MRGAHRAAVRPKAFLADTASHGEWTVNGDLFGDTVHLRDVVRHPRAGRRTCPGACRCAASTWAPLAGIVDAAQGRRRRRGRPPAPRRVAGQLWGELIVDDVPLDAPSKARGRLLLGPTFVSRGADKLTLAPAAATPSSWRTTR